MFGNQALQARKENRGGVFPKEQAQDLANQLNQEHRDIKLVHKIQPETFDEWCSRNAIVHFKESFYHYVMSKGTPPTDPEELESLWESCWKEYLNRIK